MRNRRTYQAQDLRMPINLVNAIEIPEFIRSDLTGRRAAFVIA